MRTHARYAQYAPAIDPERFHRIVAPERLAVGRLETGYSTRIDDYGCLDLIFADDGEMVVVPFLVVQGTMLFMRQSSPIVWPAWIPGLRRELARAIEDEVEPWLRSLAVARFVGDEAIRYFGTDSVAHAAFDRARNRGWLGSAPLDVVIADVAPYVYGLRFARDARVAIRDQRGASGAALLARVARVDAQLEDGVADEAKRWFGLPVFDVAERDEAYDVAIGQRTGLPDARVRIAVDGPGDFGRTVEIARPIPIWVMVSFDVEDGAALKSFGVSAPAVALRSGDVPAMPIVGGSSGRIGIVLRDDYAATPDADSDAAAALSARLSEQGFTPTLIGASHVHGADFDVLHVMGLECAEPLLASLERWDAGRAALIVSPYADDQKGEAAWGSAVHREAIANSIDEFDRGEYARAVEKRVLVSPASPSIGTPSLNDAAVRRLLGRARAAIVTGPEEERRLREAFGFTGAFRTAPALLGDDPRSSPSIAELTGDRDFVLVHAPMDARCNQYVVAEACASLGYPLLLTGPVTDANFYAEVIARLGIEGYWVPAHALSGEDLAGLYRRARVFVDASWRGRGLYRMARAAAGGAALVGPSSGYARGAFAGIAQVVDPGSSESIAAGIRTAWQRAPELGAAAQARVASQYAPFPMLVAVLAAYQQAAAV